jgi:hypothetical protein
MGPSNMQEYSPFPVEEEPEVGGQRFILEEGRGPRAMSVFCRQAQEIREAFTLLRMRVGD